MEDTCLAATEKYKHGRTRAARQMRGVGEEFLVPMEAEEDRVGKLGEVQARGDSSEAAQASSPRRVPRCGNRGNEINPSDSGNHAREPWLYDDEDPTGLLEDVVSFSSSLRELFDEAPSMCARRELAELEPEHRTRQRNGPRGILH